MIRREDWPDLAAFAAVAEERSFTRAAVRLGLTTSAVSHAVRALESRLDLSLLTRTTRSVALTDAGQTLLDAWRPALAGVDAALASLRSRSNKIAGSVRLTVHNHAMRVILPRLPKFARDYPDVVLDIAVDNRRTDIVANRFDAGIRLGDLVDKDMVSVRVGTDERGVIVASPAYLARHPAPLLPSEIAGHRCIAVRLLPDSPVHRWELEKRGRAVRVTPPAAFITNDHAGVVAAAVAGLGLAFVLESTVEPLLRDGTLVRVLEDWCPPFPGCFLYYPSGRQLTPAARALIDALRWKEPTSRAEAPRTLKTGVAVHMPKASTRGSLRRRA